MNNGVLQFTLGLTTGGFLGPLNRATEGLKTFIAGAVGFGAVVAGVKDAIESGANLEHLHQQTGESVKDLYSLQEAFRAVGVDAGQLPMMLIRMQQALSGFGRGAGNQSLFSRLGLNIQQLKNMDAPGQIDAIAQALSHVDRQTATGVVSQLFGMETGAIPFLQIIGSAKEFHEVLQKVGLDAAMAARNAAGFAAFDSDLVIMNSHVKALFYGIAGGLVPALDKLVNTLQHVDTGKFGASIGRLFGALTTAFGNGQLSELIALSLQTGFDMAVAAAPPIFEKLGYMLLSVFRTPLEYFQAGLTWAAEKMLELVVDVESKLPKAVRKAIGFNEGLTGFKAGSFSSILGDEKRNGLKFNVGNGEFDLNDINANSDKRWKEAKEKMKQIAEPLMKMIEGLAGKSKTIQDAQKTGSGQQTLGGVNEYKPQFTSLEKMGFVMGGNSLSEFARRTADNTLRTAIGVERLSSLLGPGGAGGPTTNEL